MYFLHAINSDRQTRLLNVLGQIAMILGDKKNPNLCGVTSHVMEIVCFFKTVQKRGYQMCRLI